MIRAEQLLTHSLREAPWGAAVTRILAAALKAADPSEAVRRQLRRRGDSLVVGERTYNLRQLRRLLVVGAGKAGEPMARACAEILGDALTAGLVVVKDEGAALPELAGPIRFALASHPVPDARGVAAARQIAGLLADSSADDLVLVLISGGGSALLTLPAEPVGLDDMRELTHVLLACGAPIEAINTLRKHLDLVKGGGLARLAAPAQVATLILSDVVGSPLDVIASGPSVPDSSSWEDAWRLVERFGIVGQLPAPIRARLEAGRAGQLPDTPKPGEPLFEAVQNVLVGSNMQAAQAALEAARNEGCMALLLSTYVQGEAREVGRVLGALGRELGLSGHPLPRPACLVIGGETTVTLRGDGRGGRNQELALAAVADLAGLDDIVVVTLATDGGDGPTDAAGAVVTGASLARAQTLGLDPYAYLARNDAYAFFAALGDLLKPGPTGTNVNDLAFVLAW
jgi:hydroxypyruvate reductase